MTHEEAVSLVALNLLAIREGIIEGLSEGLTVKEPMRLPNGETFVVMVSLSHDLAHIASHVDFSFMELEGNKPGVIVEMLRAKGMQSGLEIREVQARAGARALLWSRSVYFDPDAGWWSRRRKRLRGLWTRLRWAWQGHIPINGRSYV